MIEPMREVRRIIQPMRPTLDRDRRCAETTAGEDDAKLSPPTIGSVKARRGAEPGRAPRPLGPR